MFFYFSCSFVSDGVQCVNQWEVGRLGSLKKKKKKLGVDENCLEACHPPEKQRVNISSGRVEEAGTEIAF